MPKIDDTWYVRPDGVPESHTAGGVVVRKAGDRVLVALAQEKIYDEYVLPKGHVELGESVVGAARREIGEEVGISDLTLVEKLGVKTRLDFRKTEWKITHYFLYITKQNDAVPTHQEQHETMHWVPLMPVPKLFWPEQQALMEEHIDHIQAVVNRT
ncbi:MAG: ADP-ribose pyrophosphatase YjhB (NUDIX family) [Candidatus Latescibacterota bacterium]|jgi:ADP-ribose pyrophosphatase YjhB (NUDIX family)